ncbi:MAG: N(4)-(beta-N-acetylglucosaminyl)-L-asparaginase [Anaerolineae bacterium]|nr:N(4)-(beta-N-acetylglucosaminyl)-L-asparaginase [Anaerolineae bacterium]
MRIVLANSVGSVGMPAAVEAIQSDRPALDVVELGIRPVELDPGVRSVGVGGWPNLLGEVELDASIMDGRTLRTGAVGALRGYVHPISVARRVMEELPHVLLVGDGAARFAAECGAEAGETLTEEARVEWEQWLERHIPADVWKRWPDVPLAAWARLTADPETAAGTTTFLVQDGRGDIAAGVSTCGWAFKYPGRLGDSPIIGAGGYADNRYGAAACTGMGELAIRASTARSVVLYMKMGMTVEEACREAADDLRSLDRRYRGGVTIHAIDAEGRPYVLAVDRDDVTYWVWTEGMEVPERREADRA